MASLTRLFTTIDLATERGVEVPCVREDGGLWFAEDRASLDRAKALCLTCPVQEECLEGATERGESGVWGAQLLNRGRISARRPR